MKNISEIINAHISRLNTTWIKIKEKEFLSSNLYDPQSKVINVKFEEHGSSGDENISIEEEYTLIDYCLIDFNEPYIGFQHLYHSIKSQKTELITINELARLLARELFDKIKEVPVLHCNEIKLQVLQKLEENCESVVILENENHRQILSSFCDVTKVFLNDLLIERLDLQNYLRPVEEKLIFNLNKEDYTAFMRILLESKIVKESESKLAAISEKYFMYTPQGKDLTFLHASNFKREIDRHTNPDHTRNGIQNIKEKLEKGIVLIQNMQAKKQS